MNIVVLDGYTLNPGDLTWEELSELGHLTVYERTSPDQIVKRASEADILLTNKTPITAETISQLPNLTYIGVLATGYNIVNTSAAAERGIVVTNVPDYSTHSVVQLVFAFLLEHCLHVGEHSTAVHNGRWAAGPDFMFSLTPLLELAGKTIGIIGFGQIGQQVAKAAIAFGMEVCVHTRTVKQVPGLEGVRFVSFEILVEQSDFISLHCPLTPETSGIINRDSLKRMKKEAFLINTARGGHVVEQDLADALNEGVIAGAALDVLSVEPPPADHPLLHAANCCITPHIGWATIEARSRLMSIASENLRSFQQKLVVNKVN
ncbi:glycerate dehydrogenase [Paenibacillus baekrokdamisoli]|uniref:Glycerate dehydrogenase n=1 Tax=Paenibacillus baekrokdamisoli TaxID=1712516 RepID=A0A3G9JAR3_9BACL|nr:D-2-hydroxyacid dehydrogenase [Paenibacillus baekrokdamisoli]MBB3069719.1 glycerate dehydrogenase [Paenibacillus baekrokdamisoli]BBH20928.1 glycerate dehydrogenase [Paenibacillus baekrokdamisoli]